MLKRRRSAWRPSVQVRCEMIQYFALLSSVGQTICRWCVIYFSTRTKASPCVSSETVSVRSLLIVEMGKAVAVANGFVTGQGIPAWTTQRAPQNYWDAYRYPTWTLPWDLVEDGGRLFSTIKQSPSVDVAVRSQLRLEMMRFVLFSVGWSTHWPSICNIVYIR